MVDAQQWLEKKYPKEIRNKVTSLNIMSQGLTGTLDLSDFVNLQSINCTNNQLTEIKFPSTAREKLEILDLKWNNFNQDLSFLRDLVNLRALHLGNSIAPGQYFSQGIYNRFHGSLEPLQNLIRLEHLDINNTNINSGLEFLPDRLERFLCSADIIKDAEVKKIRSLLDNDQGIVEGEGMVPNPPGLGPVSNLREKLKTYRQKSQVKAEVEKVLIEEDITSEQLIEHLIKLKVFKHDKTWQIYLDYAQTLDELERRKDNLLSFIKNLKEVEQLEKKLAKLKEASEEKGKLFERKKRELERMKEAIISKYNLSEDEEQADLLDILLTNQGKVIKDNNDKVIARNLKNSKRDLTDAKVTDQEINDLCQLQEEITKLELQLGVIEESKQTIINNIHQQGIFAGTSIDIKGSVSMEGFEQRIEYPTNK